jgi:hypothetical protein
LSLPPEAVQAVEKQRDKLAGIELPDSLDSRTRSALQQVIGESFVEGFRVVMILGAALSFASAGLALVWISGNAASPAARRH